MGLKLLHVITMWILLQLFMASSSPVENMQPEESQSEIENTINSNESISVRVEAPTSGPSTKTTTSR